MYTVGLTGNVASGKSTVAAHFARWGATVIAADDLVRETQRAGSATLAAIVERFGAEMLTPDGTLDRAALRRAVMARPAERAALEAIVHPAVHQLREARVAAARGGGATIVVHDIPLLFEALDPAAFDAIVVVDADEAVRRARLTTVRGLTPEDAGLLLAAQQPAGPKRARADFVIENEGSFEDLERAAWDVWKALMYGAQAPVDRP